MGTRAGFCPGGLHLTLALWLMTAALTLQNAQAEITCASCPSPVQLHLDKLELEMRADLTEEPSTLEFKELGVADQNPLENGRPVEDFAQHVSLDGVGTKGGSDRGDVEGEEPGMAEDAALWRAKRSGPDFEFSEFSDSRWNGRAGADSLEQDQVSMLDGLKQSRPELGWGRGNNRQDESKLSSSTFALTGDSAHNHAVVYWAGHNSSVSNTTVHDFLCAFSCLSTLLHELQPACAGVNRCTGSYRCPHM
ncbi:hypothetical protein JOB18_030255 [Solea senegalensis]|uniref:Uncharacterized protein n=1 Tax=Solea senegalensis TaxID=28829 RepID=A0AAV6Q980_SOLSE|nr:hypothetical protein JOB18_030255 [Solea senegalensis]